MVVLCLEKQVDVVVFDNLSKTDMMNLQTLEKNFKATIPLFKIDIRDKDKLNQFFKNYLFEVNTILGTYHQLEKYFLKNNQGIFF